MEQKQKPERYQIRPYVMFDDREREQIAALETISAQLDYLIEMRKPSTRGQMECECRPDSAPARAKEPDHD